MTPPTIKQADRKCADDIHDASSKGVYNYAAELAAAHRELGAREERERIVEWLRAPDQAHYIENSIMLADQIERKDIVSQAQLLNHVTT